MVQRQLKRIPMFLDNDCLNFKNLCSQTKAFMPTLAREIQKPALKQFLRTDCVSWRCYPNDLAVMVAVERVPC